MKEGGSLATNLLSKRKDLPGPWAGKQRRDARTVSFGVARTDRYFGLLIVDELAVKSLEHHKSSSDCLERMQRCSVMADEGNLASVASAAAAAAAAIASAGVPDTSLPDCYEIPSDQDLNWSRMHSRWHCQSRCCAETAPAVLILNRKSWRTGVAGSEQVDAASQPMRADQSSYWAKLLKNAESDSRLKRVRLMKLKGYRAWPTQLYSDKTAKRLPVT